MDVGLGDDGASHRRAAHLGAVGLDPGSEPGEREGLGHGGARRRQRGVRVGFDLQGPAAGWLPNPVVHSSIDQEVSDDRGPGLLIALIRRSLSSPSSRLLLWPAFVLVVLIAACVITDHSFKVSCA